MFTKRAFYLLAVGLSLSAFLVVGTACMDPLVTGDYKGEALKTIEGRIFLSSDQYDEPWLTSQNLKVAIFWTGALSEEALYGDEEEQIVEQPTVTSGAFPAQYSMTLYRPPRASAIRPNDEGEGELGLALVLLYWDENANGVWDREREGLAGGTGEFLLVYTPEGASGGKLLSELAPGYHLMRLEDGYCDGDGGLGMHLAALNSKVNLTITDEVAEFMPDTDCDGFIDTCEYYIESALASFDDDERQELLSEYRDCVQDLWDESPWLAEQECPGLLDQVARDGGEVPEEIRDLYDECLGLESSDACDGFLSFSNFCESVGDGCDEYFYSAFERCVQTQTQGLGVCQSYFDTFYEVESTTSLTEGYWYEFADCLIASDFDLNDNLEQDCVLVEEEVCNDFLTDLEEDGGVTDEEYSLYLDCMNNVSMICATDACDYVFDTIGDCEDTLCQDIINAQYDVCLCENSAYDSPALVCEDLEQCGAQCHPEDSFCSEENERRVSECNEGGSIIVPSLPSDCEEICSEAQQAVDSSERSDALERFDECLEEYGLVGEYDCPVE